MSQNRMSRRAVQVVAENRIREAIEEGQFDDLPGLGKPIADIDEPYDPDWWVKKWIRREGMSRELAEKFAARAAISTDEISIDAAQILNRADQGVTRHDAVPRLTGTTGASRHGIMRTRRCSR